MFMDMVYRIKTDTIEKLCGFRSSVRKKSRRCRKSSGRIIS